MQYLLIAALIYIIVREYVNLKRLAQAEHIIADLERQLAHALLENRRRKSDEAKKNYHDKLDKLKSSNKPDRQRRAGKTNARKRNNVRRNSGSVRPVRKSSGGRKGRVGKATKGTKRTTGKA